jgi:hypothetical protein
MKKKKLKKNKVLPVQAWADCKDFRRLLLPGFSENIHMKVARLSAKCTDHLNSKEDPWY